MRTFLREPLVHFLAIGTGLFAVFAIVNDSQPAGTDTPSCSKTQPSVNP